MKFMSHVHNCIISNKIKSLRPEKKSKIWDVTDKFLKGKMPLRKIRKVPPGQDDTGTGQESCDRPHVHLFTEKLVQSFLKLGHVNFWRFIGHPNIGKILLIVLAPGRPVLIQVFMKHRGVIVRIALVFQNDTFLLTQIGSNRLQVNPGRF